MFDVNVFSVGAAIASVLRACDAEHGRKGRELHIRPYFLTMVSNQWRRANHFLKNRAQPKSHTSRNNTGPEQ